MKKFFFLTLALFGAATICTFYLTGYGFGPANQTVGSEPTVYDDLEVLRNRVAELEQEREKLFAQIRAQPPSAPAAVRAPLFSHDLVEELKTELDRVRGENQHFKDLLERLLSEIQLYRQEAGKTLVQEFLRLPETQVLDPRAQEYVARLIPGLAEIPSSWEIGELAKAAVRFYPDYEDWQRRWGSKQGELLGDFDHPENIELLKEKGKLLAYWKQELTRILGDERARRLL